MKIQFSESHAKLTPKELDQVEYALRQPLPRELRTFLLTCNGGHPYPNVFPIRGYAEGSWGILDWFVCVDTASVMDMRNLHDIFNGRLPRDLLPFARDPGGNLLCLSARGIHSGKVYYWDHEDELVEGTEPDESNLYLVAESFDGLLRNLITFTEARLEPYDPYNRSRGSEFALTDEDYVWHHVRDTRTMQLIPFDLHARIPHLRRK